MGDEVSLARLRAGWLRLAWRASWGGVVAAGGQQAEEREG
jgi:hypothetical protein